MKATVDRRTGGPDDGLVEIVLTMSPDEAGDIFLLAGQAVGGSLSEEGSARSDLVLKDICDAIYWSGALDNEPENLSKVEWAAHMALDFQKSRVLLVGILEDLA